MLSISNETYNYTYNYENRKRFFPTSVGGERAVAFKRLNDNVKSVGAKELASELLIQSKVDAHENIVKVLGAINDPFVGFGLVLELSIYGSLYDKLEDRTNVLAWELRMQLLLDVAKGVSALHANPNHQIVHGDLKSLNVLIMDAGDGGLVGKIYVSKRLRLELQ